jgi:AcrR family transcriptional regulator
MPSSRPRSARKKSYHHGDLEAALIQAAVKLLREGGPEALTLRGVARAAGVSQAAPYRHFADRRALVAAVAEDGFRLLGEAMQTAMSGGGELRPGFRGVGLAYVQFAHEHPAEYRVMFGPEVANLEDLPSLKETSRSVLEFVEHAIAGLQQAGVVGPGDPAAMAAATWSMLHGLVMLSLDRQLDGSQLSLERLVEETMRIMMFGMAAR